LDSFMNLFNTIEYVDAEKDYDRFCKVNKDNEKRKALSLFFVNLCKNGMIEEDYLVQITSSLLDKLFELIHVEGRKNEVDEMSDNIAILYNKQSFGEEFNKKIEILATAKSKNFLSLSNKSIFKFMDLIEA